MNNIFEGAKFGDKFLTRDNRIVLFIGSSIFDRTFYALIDRNQSIINVDKDGDFLYDKTIEHKNDIVSRYQEPINEDKLDLIANEFADKESIPFSRRSDIDSFKAGYRKAMEK